MMNDAYDDDEEDFHEGYYVNGHWEWDANIEGLRFVRDDVLSPDVPIIAAIVGPIEFKDDIDLLEQQRFKKRFQRKQEGSDDVVTLQDVKDLVLYVAPLSILTESVINILHLNTTERFLRALIAYCQYYIQISNEMNRRVMELETKIATDLGKEKENVYRDNLQDLRLLIAKEYSTMILGVGEFKKFHHMSTLQLSLTSKDAIMFESFIRICVQIIWIALGRKMHNIIDTEVHRLFKSQKFNAVEHKSGNETLAKMSLAERRVLLGTNLQEAKTLKTRSPLLNEIDTTDNLVDYRYLALGLLKQHRLCHRLTYLERILNLPENHLVKHNMSLGIIGLKRDKFDIMLREIKTTGIVNSSSTSSYVSQQSRKASRVSRTSSSSRKSYTTPLAPPLLYPTMAIPPKPLNSSEDMMLDFPVERSQPSLVLSQNKQQRQKWLARRKRLLMQHAARDYRQSQ